MRYLCLLFIIALAVSANAQTYSTGTAIACAAGTSCATTSGISFSTGDYAVVVVFHGTTITCPQASDTVTDSASIFTFTAPSVCAPNNNTGTMTGFVAKATGTNASVTFTAGFPASRGAPAVIVLKYTGVAASSALDQTGVASTGVTSTNLTIPSGGANFTTSVAHEVIVACGEGDSSTTSWSVGSIGGTNATAVRQTIARTGGASQFACEDLTVTTVQSTITAAMTANASGGASLLSGVVMTLKAPIVTVVRRRGGGIF